MGTTRSRHAARSEGAPSARSAQFPGRKKGRRKRYRLKPAAKQFYRNLLLCLAGVAVVVVVLRVSVFRSEFSLSGYSALEPFDIAAPVLDLIKPAAEDDLIIMDISMSVNNTASVQMLRVEFIELFSTKKYREWTLEITGNKAVLARGKTISGNFTRQKGRFPGLAATFEAFSLIPLATLVTDEELTSKEELVFTTSNYRPNVNPAFSDRVGEQTKVRWISLSGSASDVTRDWKPGKDYMAVDCGRRVIGETTAAPQDFLILLETNKVA